MSCFYSDSHACHLSCDQEQFLSIGFSFIERYSGKVLVPGADRDICPVSVSTAEKGDAGEDPHPGDAARF